MSEKFTLFTNENKDLENGGDEDFNRLSELKERESLVSTSTSIPQDSNANLQGVRQANMTTSSENIYISRKLKESIARFETPLKKLLVYTTVFFALKLSRVVLVLGLLVKLFLELTCEKSSIQTLLIAAFFRDVFSSLLDMQLMFKVYEMRYRIRNQRYDQEMKELARDVISQAKISRKDENGLQQEPEVGFLLMEEVISNRMEYLGYFMRMLKYCYYFLFFISAIFILKYDDEQFCHVFEKYAIIYLFLPIYCTFLVIALSISYFGTLLTLALFLMITILAKFMIRKYRNTQQIRSNQKWANSLESTMFEGIEDHLKGQSCSICEQSYSALDEITVLKCTHHFHYFCIKKWISMRGTCAICG